MISFSQLQHRGNSKAIGSLHVVESGSSCGIGVFWKTIGWLVRSPAKGRNGRDTITSRIGYSMKHTRNLHEGEREGEPAIRG